MKVLPRVGFRQQNNNNNQMSKSGVRPIRRCGLIAGKNGNTNNVWCLCFCMILYKYYHSPSNIFLYHTQSPLILYTCKYCTAYIILYNPFSQSINYICNLNALQEFFKHDSILCMIHVSNIQRPPSCTACLYTMLWQIYIHNVSHGPSQICALHTLYLYLVGLAVSWSIEMPPWKCCSAN